MYGRFQDKAKGAPPLQGKGKAFLQKSGVEAAQRDSGPWGFSEIGAGCWLPHR